MIASWALASSRQPPPVRRLAALPETALQCLRAGEAAIVSQSGFMGLLSGHACWELSEVWDIQNSVSTSKKCNRSPA